MIQDHAGSVQSAAISSDEHRIVSYLSLLNFGASHKFDRRADSDTQSVMYLTFQFALYPLEQYATCNRFCTVVALCTMCRESTR
ncbi:hypothetical protein BDR05DRAFT_961165 [Suillus weaverae]|nr:hypothetical protein BDR05DRAFT_961165 [Suillus weaverae]